MVGLISAFGGNQSPIAWECKRSQAMVEMGLNLRPISTETPLKMRGVFRGCVGPEKVAFAPVLCYYFDTKKISGQK